MQYYKSWRALFPDADRPESQIRELIALFKSGARDQALAALESGRIQSPFRFQDTALSMAATRYLILSAAGETVLAQKELDTSKLLDVHDFNVLSDIATRLGNEYALGEPALPFYKSALAINPYAQYCVRALGEYYFGKEDYRIAEKYFLDLNALNGPGSYAEVLLGRTYKMLGEADRARAYFRSSLKTRPEDTRVQHELMELPDPVFIFD